MDIKNNNDFQSIVFALGTILCGTLKHMEDKGDGMRCCLGYTEYRIQFYIKLASFNKEEAFRIHKDLVEVEHKIVEKIMINPPNTQIIEDDEVKNEVLKGEGSLIKVIDEIQAFQKLRKLLLKTAMIIDFNSGYWRDYYIIDPDRVSKYCIDNNFTGCSEKYLIKLHKLSR